MNDNFDLIVIGAGPAGYACAIKAAQLGMRVACVEKNKNLGGTCLNVGCIPSKALLHASERFSELRDHGASMGIVFSELEVDLEKMMSFKQEAIAGNVKGVAYLFKKNKVELITGVASLKTAGHVNVHLADGTETVLGATHIVIATGSEPSSIPGVTVDEKYILSSTGALSLESIPETMVIIGGGFIGVEMGAIWSRLGTKIAIVEYGDTILSSMDKDVSKTMRAYYEKHANWKFITQSSVEGVKLSKSKGDAKKCVVRIKSRANGEISEIESSVVLVAVGRQPCVKDLELEKLDIAVSKRGHINVRGASYQTTLPGIYAIGDVIGGAMLAHKAMEEGTLLAEYLYHQRGGQLNTDAIPSVVYTMPEVAAVGKTEEQARAEGLKIKVGTFPLTANGRAKAIQATTGFIKIIADESTDRVLGVHMVAPHASEMIHEAVAIIEFGGSSEDIARMCHAHPTFSEATKEAALAVTSLPLHM